MIITSFSSYISKFIAFPPVTRRQKTTLIFLSFSIVFFPYQSSPGGYFSLTNIGEQKLQAPYNGTIVSAINQASLNRIIRKGAVIANVQSDDLINEYNQSSKQLAAQRADVNSLEYQLQAAKRLLDLYKSQYFISSSKYRSQLSLFKTGAISFDSVLDTQRVMETDSNNIRIQVSSIAKVNQDLQSELQSLSKTQANWRYLSSELKKSRLLMPFDGYLYAPNLHHKLGSIVNQGDILATATSNKGYFGSMQLPEVYATSVHLNDRVTIRLESAPSVQYKGLVYRINQGVVPNDKKGQITTNQASGVDSTSVKSSSGNVIEVVVKLIDQPSQSLSPGQTGWAKIQGSYSPAVVVFTRSIVRFFLIEVWSWFP